MSKTKHTYRHIGYFNDYQDIQELFLRTADEIVKYMKNGWGAFHFCEGDRDSDIDKIEGEPDECLLSMTADKEYIVKYQRGGDEESWYIDIYQYHILEIVEENKVDTIYEYCSFCDDEVELVNEFKVQICPKCGKAIVPCNICPFNSQGKCSTNCPLEALANELNEKTNYGTEYSIASFVSTFNSSTEKQWIKGFILTILDENDNIDYVLRIFYLKEYDVICFMNERDSDKGWFMKEPKRLSIDYLEYVFEMLGIVGCKIYVKVLE